MSTRIEWQTRRDPAVVPHEHGWVVDSSHRTSLGRVLYVRCAGCGARRIDLDEMGSMPPTPISSEMRGAGGGA